VYSHPHWAKIPAVREERNQLLREKPYLFDDAFKNIRKLIADPANANALLADILTQADQVIFGKEHFEWMDPEGHVQKSSFQDLKYSICNHLFKSDEVVTHPLASGIALKLAQAGETSLVDAFYVQDGWGNQSWVLSPKADEILRELIEAMPHGDWGGGLRSVQLMDRIFADERWLQRPQTIDTLKRMFDLYVDDRIQRGPGQVQIRQVLTELAASNWALSSHPRGAEVLKHFLWKTPEIWRTAVPERLLFSSMWAATFSQVTVDSQEIMDSLIKNISQVSEEEFKRRYEAHPRFELWMKALALGTHDERARLLESNPPGKCLRQHLGSL
jgi:hypothetical protein